MFLNKDIENLMLNDKNVNVKDKFKAVAIAIPTVVKKLGRMQEKRREVMKKKPDVIEKWGNEEFILPDLVAQKEGSSKSKSAGRPKKRLSENLCAKTETKILDDILSTIEKLF